LFDAVNHSFSTLATGGFSTKNASIAAFESPFIHWVTIVFMYLAGVNFALHFRAAIGTTALLARPGVALLHPRLLAAAVVIAGLNLAAGTHDVARARAARRALPEPPPSSRRPAS
jgi:trk system potassium uptake protein